MPDGDAELLHDGELLEWSEEILFYGRAFGRLLCVVAGR
jgi:hypothetical protein